MQIKKIVFSVKNFNNLTCDELYQILQLRSEIFVVEQDCVYQDIDGKDQQALHILGKINTEIVAYARCFPPKIYFEEAAIGRVLVRETHRKSGFAHQLIQASIAAVVEHYKTHSIKISAQEHLKKFYQSHGFRQIGTGYLEDGIPHIAMVKND